MTEPRWSEESSVAFAELGQYATPWRDELTRAFLALLPGSPDEQLLVVDLAGGTGWLGEIGFVGVDAFWVKAGHALFGGYKGTVRSGE